MSVKQWLRDWLLGEPVAPPVVEQKPGMSVSPRVLEQFAQDGSNRYLAQLGSKVVVAREVRPYAPPPGVVPDAPQRQRDQASDPFGAPFLAMDDGAFAPQYTWLNQFACGLGFPGYATLSELAQRSEYRAPSEVIGKEMTRKFITFSTKAPGDKSDKIAQLEAEFKRLDVRSVCRKALQLDLFFGRAQIFIDIDGQETDDARGKPLVVAPETIKKGALLGFKVIEPIWTTPYTYNSTDPTKPDFYVPYAWYVLGRKVHHTRLLTIISRPVPDLLKPAYNFGGISLTQLMEPYVIRWLRTVDSVNRIINNYSVMMLKTDMQQVLSGDQAAGKGLLDRAKLFVSTRDNQALTLLNKDTEEMEQIAVPLSGLDELQAQAQEHMAAPSHIPLVKLTGVTPSGLNASSEGEIQVFYDFIHAEQESVLEPVLDSILDLVQLSLFGEIDENIDYEFTPLTEPTRKEVADIRKSDGDLAVSLINSGVVSPDEVREMLQSNPDSGYTNLTGDAPAPPEPGEPGGISLHAAEPPEPPASKED